MSSAALNIAVRDLSVGHWLIIATVSASQRFRLLSLKYKNIVVVTEIVEKHRVSG